jgi:hypothetical protein
MLRGDNSLPVYPELIKYGVKPKSRLYKDYHEAIVKAGEELAKVIDKEIIEICRENH